MIDRFQLELFLACFHAHTHKIMQLLKQYILKIKAANQLSQEASNSDLAQESEKPPQPQHDYYLTSYSNCTS